MKLAATMLGVAVACLLLSSLMWLRAGAGGGSGAPGAFLDGTSVTGALADFEGSQAPVATVDIAERYAGRADLLDPRLALPTWHRFANDEAMRLYHARQSCPAAEAVAPFADAALAKAFAWHGQTCSPGSTAPEALVEHAPFMHPSGRSYAALALARGTLEAAAVTRFVRAHARSFHVLELARLDPTALDDSDRALASLPASAWASFTRGDRLVLTPTTLVVAEHGPLGLAKLRVYAREAWEQHAARRSLVLRPRGPATSCLHPASTDLCWHPVTTEERHRPLLRAGTLVSALLVTLATFALGGVYLVERRRIHADRIHVLRTLTHELRTPATTLRLDIEPLRAAYDELPASCQEPLLRISDGIERLHRVLHRSARYMALFETAGASAERLVKLREVPSVAAMFEDLAEEWPEGVMLAPGSADGAVQTDPEWLGVAVRNLVENAVRHGAPPVAVSWRLGEGSLVVRVTDAGETRSFSVRRAILPYARDARSPGLGLGLAIVDRVARLLRGRLIHEPSPTAFELRLPIGTPQEAA